MAPLGSVAMLGWFSSPEVVMISAAVFVILSITLVALCARCHRTNENAYDVNGITNDGANGITMGAATDGGNLHWRNHDNMPASTIDRTRAVTN